jgi:RHH-type proline utilization regulon transcriptional repressor/proline dehydrogenase/delta 1-pyrroline-5-carboxylate dehydrogenase
MQVGPSTEPSSRMGPIIAPADGKLLRALTRLEPGERWALAPRRLDEAGAMWTPGIKSGVEPYGEYHLTEYFGPVLGIMRARDLDHALELQNAVAYGLTAGLHSLDAAEIAAWVDGVQAGTLYVNRGTTGAIVRRQPFGGWKRSVVGPTAKAGGPNYLLSLGTVHPAPEPVGAVAAGAGAAVVSAPVNALIEGFADAPGGAGGAASADDARAYLHRAARSDARAWQGEFCVTRDVSGLTAERNAFRYLPLPVTIRASAGVPAPQVGRVLIAALRAGAPVELSTAVALSPRQAAAAAAAGIAVRIETEDVWLSRAATLHDARMRLIGASAADLLAAVGGTPDLAIYDNPVTESGRVELLPFLREQAISITAHRFGTPSPLVDAVPLTA